MQTVALWLYGVVTWALQPLVRARLKRRATHEPLYGQWIEERFGHYSQSSSTAWVWVHAVSLGETRAAAILLKELRDQIPGMKLLLTHGTATGREEGTKLLRDGDIQVWQPWDNATSTLAFFAHFKPRIGIVMETEVWPQLCAAARKEGVPLILANARLNGSSAAKSQRLAWLSRPAFASFAQVLAQTSEDAARLHAVGAQRVQVMGNLKFDVSQDNSLLTLGYQLRALSPAQHVVLLASSREGEEVQFLEQIQQFTGIKSASNATDLIARTGRHKIQWLIVPRHPQRFDEVQRMCVQSGLSVSRRSNWSGAPQQADVWLGDSMGEMPMYYALADVALLGGSFEPLGGQNLIEAIAAGCPVVMGPHTFNFAEACETAQEMGAALRSEGMAQAFEMAVNTVQSASDMQVLKQQGQHWLAQSRGAAKRMARAIAQI